MDPSPWRQTCIAALTRPPRMQPEHNAPTVL
jgi:hypothetical protein